MVFVIMIRGPSGAGKDTFGELIRSNDNRFVRYAFADEAKIITARKNGFKEEIAFEINEKDKPREEFGGKTARDLVRIEWIEMRSKNSRCFVDMVIEKIVQNRELFVVITDLRYPIEYTAFCERFGKENIKTVNISRDIVKLNEEREEENGFTNCNFLFDFDIFNDDTFAELSNKAVHILHKIKQKI